MANDLTQINEEYDAMIHHDAEDSGQSKDVDYEANRIELQAGRKFVENLIPQLFSLMTYIKFKSNYLRLCNKVSNILIIIFSSIITFIEALRANTQPTEYVDMGYTLFTLTLGFIIALLASIVKFFNFQGKIEKLGYLTNMLEVPYLDSSKLLEKIKIKSKPERDNEFVQIVRSEILKIIENYCKPQIDANNILPQHKMSEYMQRHNTHKKQIDDILINQLNIQNAMEIERYAISLKDEIAAQFRQWKGDDPVEKLHLFANRLEKLNKSFDKYREQMTKLYKRDNIDDFHTEIKKIEWYKCKNIFGCFKPKEKTEKTEKTEKKEKVIHVV